MKKPIASKIYAKSLHAFIEKAFRSVHGQKLSNEELYINFIVGYLEKFLNGHVKQLLVNLPGRHLKTFMCSVCLPAFMLGIDPRLKFLIVAYNAELAEDIVRQIREIMQSDWYKAVFPTLLDNGHSKKRDFKVSGGGRVRASAVDSVTGKGGNIVIFDDPHNAHDWDNEPKKAKVIQAFELLVSRRDEGKLSRMLVVGHRIADNDLSNHILERGGFDRVRLPLYAPKDMSFDLYQSTWHLAKGEALRPDAFPPDEIKSIRFNHQGAPFWLYYQQGLGSKKYDSHIDVSHFRFIDWDKTEESAQGTPVVLSVDPAQKTESASRNVVHVYGVRGNHYVLLQAFAEKCSFSELGNKVKTLAQMYGASMILVENTARGPDLIEKLQGELNIEIVPVNPRGSKSSRLRDCMPIIRAKRVQIRQKRRFVVAAIDEIVAYPNGTYDDHVDAMTNFLLKAATFTASTFFNARRLQPASAALATSKSTNFPVPMRGMAIAQPSSLSRLAPLPDFSNGRPAMHERRLDGRSHYAAVENSEPIISFDGEKIVRIK